MGYVKDIAIGGETYLIEPILYGVCETAAATAAKTATISNFELVEGVTIKIAFTNTNSASAPTLQINSTAAKPIYLSKGNISLWDAGEIVTFTYNGTNWIINDYGKVEVVRL